MKAAPAPQATQPDRDDDPRVAPGARRADRTDRPPSSAR
jgi:hypothetical protein